ncbi:MULTISPECIES: DUF6221 family protein [unclassified Nocardiopsis]|uniref:DUF6221 family protein n=1 Tax=Nocardiopsis TaxID=2013 RepID=UPI00387AB162
MTIVDFLNARLDEDQAAARAAAPGPWKGENTKVFDNAGDPVADTGSPTTAEHITRHDPARVLREVALRRRIVREVDEYTRFSRDRLAGEMSRQVLGALAGTYADHPDFNPDWAV